MERRRSKQVKIGDVPLGGDAPVSVQSMTNTDTRDTGATLDQITELHNAGCDIIRVAVPDKEAAESLAVICKKSPIPVVADIHFDHRLALLALEGGVDGLRINPGNIGGSRKVKEVARGAQSKGIPIRVGINSGSLPKDLLSKHSGPSPEAMVEGALRHINLLLESDFSEIIISLKSTSVRDTVKACRLLAKKVNYPFHLGITEAGTLRNGTVKSAIGIGSLLLMGIGDTLRVSLTTSPIEEVRVGIAILQALDLRAGVELISCPTCGRCEIDLEALALEVEKRIQGIDHPLKVAVMGCAVNGPGEAREADIGVAGGRKRGVIFRGGEVVATASEDELIDRLMEELFNHLAEDTT